MHSVHVDVLSDGACCNFPCFQSKWVGIVGKCGKAEQFYNASALGAGFQFTKQWRSPTLSVKCNRNSGVFTEGWHQELGKWEGCALALASHKTYGLEKERKDIWDNSLVSKIIALQTCEPYFTSIKTWKQQKPGHDSVLVAPALGK